MNMWFGAEVVVELFRDDLRMEVSICILLTTRIDVGTLNGDAPEQFSMSSSHVPLCTDDLRACCVARVQSGAVTSPIRQVLHSCRELSIADQLTVGIYRRQHYRCRPGSQ